MREIKFRAWDKRKKKLIYFDELEIADTGGFWKGDREIWKVSMTAGIGKCKGSGYWHSDLAEEVKREDICLMQFTGLQDKNGRDIYKGDIVKVESWDMVGKNPFAEIIWEPDYKVEHDLYGHYSMCSTHLIRGRNVSVMLREALDILNIEVIGNIYENSELLEEKK